VRNGQRGAGYTAFRAVGGILPPESLHSIAALKEKRQGAAEYGLLPSLNLREEIGRYFRIASDLHRRYAERRERRDLSAV